jgi:hypothetical protein
MLAAALREEGYAVTVGDRRANTDRADWVRGTRKRLAARLALSVRS